MTSGRFTALTSILFKVKCQADKNYIQYSPHFLQYGHCICGNITFYWDNIQSKYSLIVIMASRNHIQYVSSTSTNHDLHNPTRTARTVSVQECSKKPHLTMNLLHPPWGWHEDAGMLCEARVCLAEWDGWVGGCGWVMWVHMEVFRVSKQQWNLHFPSSPETPLKKCQLLEGKRGVKQKPATYSHWHMQVYTNTSGHCLLSSVSWSDRILKRQLDGGVIIKGGGENQHVVTCHSYRHRKCVITAFLKLDSSDAHLYPIFSSPDTINYIEKENILRCFAYYYRV